MASEDAFAEEYIGLRRDEAHPCYMKWTMVFQSDDRWREEAYQRVGVERVLASNARAMACIDRMTHAFARTDPASAPDAEVYARFREGMDKTVLYLRTFYLWRECWWRRRADRDLGGEPKRVNAEALHRAGQRLMPLFDAWGRYPEEAGFWRVTFRHGRPSISPDDIWPYWHPRGEATMETGAADFGPSPGDDGSWQPSPHSPLSGLPRPTPSSGRSPDSCRPSSGT